VNIPARGATPAIGSFNTRSSRETAQRNACARALQRSRTALRAGYVRIAFACKAALHLVPEFLISQPHPPAQTLPH